MNINEIAKMAGVSRATVSRYLNDGYVSEEKKEAIRAVIEETGYEPSTQAQNLRKKVTKIIGVIIPKLQSESVSRMVDGISSVLAKEGYQLLLANTNNNEKEELNYLKIFRKNRVDGIIFMGTIFSRTHFRRMEETEVPIVVTGQEMKDFSCVYQDDYHAAFQAAKLLLEKGTHIGYLGVTTKDKAAGYQRKKGFSEALRQVQTKESYMKEAEFSVESGYTKAKELMEEYPQIDSLFCATDSIAVGAMKYLSDAGIEVPNQVQLLGFGDSILGEIVTPSMTTIHYYYKTTGMEAARLLLEILDTGEDLKKAIKMGFQVKKKQSTRA